MFKNHAPWSVIPHNPIACRGWGCFLAAAVMALGLAGCSRSPAVQMSLDQNRLRASAAEDVVGPTSADPNTLLRTAHNLRWLGDYLRTKEHLDACEDLLQSAGQGGRKPIALQSRLALAQGWLHYDRGEWQDGWRQVRQALRDDPGNRSLKLIYGLLCARDRKRSEAFRLADEFDRREELSTEAPWIRSSYRVATGSLSEAYELIFNAHPHGTHNAECWRAMGEIAESLQEYSQANQWYGKSFSALPVSKPSTTVKKTHRRLKPGSLKTHQDVWLAYDRYYITGSLSAYTSLALERFERAPSGERKSFWAEQVVNAAGIMLRKNIDEPWAYRARGLVLAFGEQNERAIRDLHKAIHLLADRVPPEGRLQGAMGHLFLEEKDHIQARAYLERAVQLEPDDATYWRDLGLALIMDKETEAAEQALTRSLALDDSFPTTWYNRGLMYLHRKDYTRARADLEEAARRAPDNPEVGQLIQKVRMLESRNRPQNP